MYENILIKNNFKLLEKRKGKKDKIRSRSEDVAQWHKAFLASTRPWDRLLSLKQVYLLH